LTHWKRSGTADTEPLGAEDKKRIHHSQGMKFKGGNRQESPSGPRGGENVVAGGRGWKRKPGLKPGLQRKQKTRQGKERGWGPSKKDCPICSAKKKTNMGSLEKGEGYSLQTKRDK